MALKPVSCRIPELINSKGKTQQWLADRSGMSKQQLNNYIAMRNIMGLIVAKNISDVLSVSIEDLYEWE